MKPARKHATYDDVLRAPETMVAELIEGDLYTSPRPAIPHARSASALMQDLRSFDGPPGDPERPGGWWILVEPELHFGADVLVPDLAGWRRSRLSALPPTPYFTLAPDWVCEVLSPSTETIDRAKKLGIYARAEVQHAWLVNPVLQTLEVLALASGRWTLVATHEGRAAVRAEPFDAIELELGALWA